MDHIFNLLTKQASIMNYNIQVKECNRQFPLIVDEGREPDYDTCIKISTEASLRESILPGALVIFSPIYVYCCPCHQDQLIINN